MGMGTTGIPWVPWDSHGNRSDNEYIPAPLYLHDIVALYKFYYYFFIIIITGMGMGVGITVWEWE